MSNEHRTPPQLYREIAAVLAGGPSWITADLVEKTLRVMQRHYGQPLTANDALEIITNIGHLFDVLEGGSQSEDVRLRTGQRQVSR